VRTAQTVFRNQGFNNSQLEFVAIDV